MANYPTDGYRTTGARELSMPSRRNSGNAAPQPRVATAPRYNPSGDLRNVTIIPPNNTPTVTTPARGGKTIHVSPGQLQTVIDNSRIRNAPNAGNGLTIELTEKEYRDVQRGKTRGMLRGILRALGRNPLFRDLRLRLALHLLELVLDLVSGIGKVEITGDEIVPAAGWEHWSYNPAWGPSMGFGPNMAKESFMDQIVDAPAGHSGHAIGTVAFRNLFTPSSASGWEAAPHESELFGQYSSGQGPTETLAAVWRVHAITTGNARWHHLTTYRRRSGSLPWSWSLMTTSALVRLNPQNFATPTGTAAPKTGVKGNGGYHAPGQPTKTKQPDLPNLPPVRVRERKLTATGAAARLWFGIGTVTEAGDFITAIWNALPNSVKYRAFVQNGKRKLNPYERAVVIFNNLDKVDLPRAILNVVENQIEDMLYGKVGKGLGLATQVHAPSRPIGLGAGGWTKGFQYTGE